jgi:predicted ferric reductase
MNQRLLWYSVRASGVVAWVLVTASVAWGLLLAAKRTKRPRPAWVLDLHRFLGGLTWAFIAVHLVALSFDRWVGFGISDLIVPMASSYRPGAVAYGIVATYLLAAIQATSLMMDRIPRRAWHAVHLSSIAVFGASTTHAVLAGTDGRRLVALGSMVVVTLAVCGLGVWRVVVRSAAKRQRARVGARLTDRELLPARTLRHVDRAIAEVIHSGEDRRRTLARHGHHRRGVPRGTPR